MAQIELQFDDTTDSDVIEWSPSHSHTINTFSTAWADVPIAAEPSNQTEPNEVQVIIEGQGATPKEAAKDLNSKLEELDFEYYGIWNPIIRHHQIRNYWIARVEIQVKWNNLLT